MLRHVSLVLFLSITVLLAGCGGPDLNGSWSKTGTAATPTPLQTGDVTTDVLGGLFSIMSCSDFPDRMELLQNNELIINGNTGGKWEILDANRLKLSVANGMMQKVYTFSLAGDRLTLSDDTSCPDVYYSRQ